jgi:hypothetical protein
MGDDTRHVITGLVPVISFAWSAVLFFTGMAGTSPAMTWSDVCNRSEGLQIP